ncbi:PREDICTED: pectinesterase inhibitor-like, partial [Camelina sativa]|uniref:Pectinesterase inhibitor-like n=1 Tax=Camelina sativa TaxID=90675 RepID=A0ABM0WAS3_CAMSA
YCSQHSLYFFSIFFFLFIHIQIALSQPVWSDKVPQHVQVLCKNNIYPSLCVSTLNLDPRSKNSNIRGLASISMDATSKKVQEMLVYLIYSSKNIKDSEDLKKYKTCIDEYGSAARRFLPASLADLKAGEFSVAKSDMKNVVLAINNCQAQFAGSSLLAGRNKVVDDIADMTADIIKYFFANY